LNQVFAAGVPTCDYWPRRPDFDDVAGGLACGARTGGGVFGARRSGATGRAVFGFLEKSGM